MEYYTSEFGKSGGNINVNLNTWNHIVFRVDSTENRIEMFINGILDPGLTSNYSDDGVNNISDRLWQIGGWYPRSQGHNHAFHGKIDEVAVWNTRLTDNDISTLYNNGNGNISSYVQPLELLAYYDFEQVSGKIVKDISGNQNHGTSSLDAGLSFQVPFNPGPNSSINPTSVSSDSVVPDDYETINDAIENASNGDTIYVKSGFYDNTFINVNKNVTVISFDGPESTVLSGNGSSKVINFSSSAEFIGFTIANGRGVGINDGSESAITIKSNTNVIFRDSIIRDNRNTQTWSYAPVSNSGTAKFYNTRFTNNYGYYGGALHNRPGGKAEIYNCTFDNNEAYHASAIWSHADGVIVKDTIFYRNNASSSHNNVIESGGQAGEYENVTFVNNNDYAFSRNTSDGSKNIIKNAIVYNNVGFLNYNDGGTSNSSYDVSYSVIEGGYLSGTNIASNDPLFIDPDNDNYFF